MSITEEAPSFQNVKFEPLSHPITHFRLLEVSPRVNRYDSIIKCRSRCVRLADYDQCYTALSYAWSPTTVKHEILINGSRVLVRSNIYDFLYTYRQKLMNNALPTVFLWIDVLCLDFSNVSERNAQAQIMPNIFSRAKTVLAWLEPFPPTTQIIGGRDGLRTMVNFLSIARQDLDLNRNFHNDRHLCSNYAPSPGSGLLRYDAEWRALLQLCQHRYWSRLWILLENRFAQNLMFMYDEFLWAWEDFRAPFVLMWYLTEWRLYEPNLYGDFDPALVLSTPAADVVSTRLYLEPRTTSKSSETIQRYTDVGSERWQVMSIKASLADLVMAHKRRSCSDPLDKIYALVGLSNSTLVIDYGRSNIELFCAVLLNMKEPPELSFVSTLAHLLDVSAFQYQQNRRSMIKDVPSSMFEQSTADIIGQSCQTVYSVKSISARTEISDVLQARLGIQKLNHYRVTAQQTISKMSGWTDVLQSDVRPVRMTGHTPGDPMPIVDGFDLSRTKFRAAIFLNPNSRNGRAVFGIVSTDAVGDGDILVTDERLCYGIVIRISGLSKMWLTVIGIVLFARKVTVESELSSSGAPITPNSTIRSSSLSEFCEHAAPTAFTITARDSKDHITLQPHGVQLQSPLSGSSVYSGRHSRSTSRTTNSSVFSDPRSVENRRFTSRSDRLERVLEVINPLKRRASK